MRSYASPTQRIVSPDPAHRAGAHPPSPGAGMSRVTLLKRTRCLGHGQTAARLVATCTLLKATGRLAPPCARRWRARMVRGSPWWSRFAGPGPGARCTKASGCGVVAGPRRRRRGSAGHHALCSPPCSRSAKGHRVRPPQPASRPRPEAQFTCAQIAQQGASNPVGQSSGSLGRLP